VIVQERYEVAVSWVQGLMDNLLSGMVWRSFLALVLVIVLVTAISSLVMRGLNVFSKSRLSRFFRRRAGIKTADTTGGSNLSSGRRSHASLVGLARRLETEVLEKDGSQSASGLSSTQPSNPPKAK
jgi:hypothetical protein